MDLISVLMPAHNAERFVREAIKSILSQSYPHWELLVCDDASNDSTWAELNTFSDPRIKLFRNATNQGKAKTVNELYKTATGDLITVHDADDISMPERFSRIVDLFDSRADVFMCGHSLQRMTSRGRLLPLFRSKVSDYDAIRKDMLDDNTTGDASLFIKRVVLEDLGEVYRPYFKNNMDYDLALRVIEKYQVTNIPDVLLLYRNVSGSISKGVASYHKLITQEITKVLARQRREQGLDALQRDDVEELRQLEEMFSQPFIQDKTLHFRKMAAFFMYCRMNAEAVRFMTRAVMKEPLKFDNWRTLQYCIRKTLFRI